MPSRIVLMGTSKMSLHDRFSKISRAARTGPVRNQVTVYHSAEHDYRDKEPKPVILDDKNEYLYTDDVINDEYSLRYRIVRPRQRFVHLPSSLRNRVNFPPHRQNGSYPATPRGVNRRTFLSKPKPRVFRQITSNGNIQSNRFIKSNFYTGGFKPSRNLKAGRGRGVRNRGNFNASRFKREPVTHEDLDKELDAYMKKGKHPHIDVSDLV